MTQAGRWVDGRLSHSHMPVPVVDHDFEVCSAVPLPRLKGGGGSHVDVFWSRQRRADVARERGSMKEIEVGKGPCAQLPSDLPGSQQRDRQVLALQTFHGVPNWAT